MEITEPYTKAPDYFFVVLSGIDYEKQNILILMKFSVCRGKLSFKDEAGIANDRHIDQIVLDYFFVGLSSIDYGT